MRIGRIELPEPVLTAVRDGKLVVFAGTGVSMGSPANLPDFPQLATEIAAGTDQVRQKGEPEDRFLGRLHREGIKVHERAAKRLTGGGLAHTALHRDLLRLCSTPESIRIVTTNFDLLFEQAAENISGQRPEIFRAPALPLGRDFKGIVHIHGAVSRPDEMVLTDADFGRAYLTEGWARRFLVDLFRHWTVLFVGYSHNDVIVSYLARAIPESEAARFALTPDTEGLQRWKVLGIEPITYPQASKDDHSSLYEGVGRFADIVGRSILDWQREITDFASKPPPVDGEAVDIIEDALTDVPKTRFFTKAASSPEWITWLDGRKHLDALFGDGQPTKQDELLATWLAKHFLAHHSDEFFLLMAKHRMHVNPTLWNALAWEIALQEGQQVDGPLFSRWISLLLETFPVGSEDMLLWLGERCIKQGDVASLLDIFDTMMRGNLQLKPGFAWPREDGTEPRDRVDVDITPLADHHAAREIWEKGLKPHLEHIVERLLVQVVRRVESYHFTLRAWQKASPRWDPMSWRRSAIEPHDQDRYPGVFDVLIDAARDSLEWLVGNRIVTASRWCEYLSGSQVPILRRLAVCATNPRADISPDEKLEWLLTHGGLHDMEAHHEIYRLVASAYPGATPDCRKKIIEAVLTFQWPHEEDPDKERHTTRNHFDWLHWIHTAAPQCDLAKQALDSVSTRCPNWAAHEHPDLTHLITEGGSDRGCPWSVEDLLAKPPGEWLEELLSFQPSDSGVGGRWDLISIVKEAAKSNLKWGFNLADSLARENKWHADLWDGLLQAWPEMELDESQATQVLNWADTWELYGAHARGIADVLQSLVKNGGSPYTLTLLPRANSVATTLWPVLDRSEQADNHDDWLNLAIIRPAGVLAQFWVESLSLWRKHQDPVPTILNDEYRQALSGIAEDQSLAGRLGRSILASQFAFLLASDEAWTRSRLLPLFDPDNGMADFQAAWDGFLAWGRLDPPVVDAMTPMFLKAVGRLDADLAGRGDRFVEYYTYALGFFVGDPADRWVPELLTKGGREAGNLFASHVKQFLRDMEHPRQKEWWQRWLKQYWQNRLDGVPMALGSDEVKGMLDWLPHLTAVFPEAVDLAVRMTPTPIRDTALMYWLNKSELPEQQPDSVAKLLIYLESTRSEWYVYKAKEIIDRLFKRNLKPGLEHGLKELAARLGLA